MLDKDIIKADAERLYRDGETFTYIAKDKDSDMYKIGISRNLRSRIAALRYNTHHDHYRIWFELYAFTPGNIEERVQRSIVKAGGKPVGDMKRKGKKPMEYVTLEPGDIDIVIDAFCFQKVENGEIPLSYVMKKNGEHEGLFFRYSIPDWELPKKQKK